MYIDFANSEYKKIKILSITESDWENLSTSMENVEHISLTLNKRNKILKYTYHCKLILPGRFFSDSPSHTLS